MLKTFSKYGLSITVKILLALVLIFSNLSLSFAQDKTFDRSQYATFNVSKYLTVDKAQGTNTGTQEQSYLKSENPVAAFILQIINFITLIAASLSFLAVVVGGFLMMSSAGNANQVNKGKEILMRAIVGLVITLSAYFIVAFVQNLLFETAAK